MAYLRVSLLVLVCGFSSLSAQSVVQRVKETTLPSGWRVDCLVDEVYGTRQCFAAKFGLTIGSGISAPFRIVFIDTVGPEVQPGFNTFPGKVPIVRVDSSPPIFDMHAPELIEQLRNGTIVRAEYYVWPSGAERMTLDPAGFSEAYDLLLQKVKRR